MKKFLAALMITALAGLGCGEESPPGGPGVDPAAMPNGNGVEREPRDEDMTFTIVVPELTTRVEAGETETVSITIRRGDRFQEPVTLEFQAPRGVQFHPQNPTIHPDQDDVDVTISVQPTAPPGEHEVTVTATPQTGSPTSARFTLQVQERDNGVREGVRDDREQPAFPRETAPQRPGVQPQQQPQQPGAQPQQPGAQQQPGFEQDPLQQPPADQP